MPTNEVNTTTIETIATTTAAEQTNDQQPPQTTESNPQVEAIASNMGNSSDTLEKQNEDTSHQVQTFFSI